MIPEGPYNPPNAVGGGLCLLVSLILHWQTFLNDYVDYFGATIWSRSQHLSVHQAVVVKGRTPAG